MTSRLTDRHCGNDIGCPRCGAEDETINHMLFECPPAKQCWALSSIPSVFTNFDFLLWRAREGGAQQDTLAIFPCLMWYVWKARNEKLFKAKDISPLDTLQMAKQEAESWRLAQIMEESAENLDDLPEPTSLHIFWPLVSTNPDAIRCQTDASWVHEAKLVGFGFVATKGSDRLFVGLGAKLNNGSPLHAELEALIWAMENMIRLGRLDVHFESDCAQMIKIINEEEEWSSLEMELDEFLMIRQHFENFTISFIPRSENIRADSLAKGSRSSDSPFSYVGQLVPQWLGHHPNLFASA